MRNVLSRINPGPRLDRMIAVVSFYAKGIARLWVEKDIFLMAQAIAFKVLVTIVPVLILLTGILGWILAREQPFASIAAFINEFLPPYQSEQFLAFLYELQLAWGTFTLIGAVALFITAVTLFTTLRRTVYHVFRQVWRQERSIVGGYLFDARMALQVGVFFLLTIAVSIGFQVVDALGAELIADVGLDYLWIEEGWQTTFQVIAFLLPLFITMAMFFQLYYFIPKPNPPVRSVLLGALVAGLLWEVVKYAFTIYARYLGSFERYLGDDTGLGPIGEAFGLIIFFVFWVYYSGVIFLLGAFFTLIDEEKLLGTQHQANLPDEHVRPETHQPKDGNTTNGGARPKNTTQAKRPAR